MKPFSRKLNTDGTPAVNTKGQPLFIGPVQLVSKLSDATLENTNGTKYKVVTVKYVANSGEVKQCGASVYEGNYSKGALTVGQEYLATVTIARNAEGKLIPYMQMSHLIASGGYADLGDFVTEEALAETTVYDGTTIR